MADVYVKKSQPNVDRATHVVGLDSRLHRFDRLPIASRLGATGNDRTAAYAGRLTRPLPQQRVGSIDHRSSTARVRPAAVGNDFPADQSLCSPIDAGRTVHADLWFLNREANLKFTALGPCSRQFCIASRYRVRSPCHQRRTKS